MRISVLAIFKTVILVLLLVVLGVGGYWAYNRIPTVLEKLIGKPEPATVSPGRQVVVAIPKGASLSQVATILEEEGVISSRLIFKLVAMIRGEQRKIQAGEYELRTGSDAGVVLDQLISGKTLIFPFTCPEGYNIFQVAELFEQTGKMPREEFLKTVQDREFIKELGVASDSLEGYLFPDTYFLLSSEKKDGKLLIRKMVKRFQEVYEKNVRPTAEKYGWTEHEVLTLASLIEKEAKGSEHPLVSAVFHNRLRKGMRLQSDPTVIYGIKPMGSPITKADLNSKHTYNTYQNSGLPPGPIANPGKASLIAAVKPADVDYLYFVAKNDGTHQFSSNLQDHNRWVNLYQRQPRELSR